MLSYREHAPPPALAPWLECIWEREDSGAPVRVLPDGCIDVVWARGTEAQVVGPNLTAFVVTLAPSTHAVGARLRPGAAGALLGIAPEELRDARIPVQSVLAGGGQRWTELLEQASDPAAAMRAGLLVRARSAAAPDSLVQAAVRVLARAESSVASTAQDLAVSERQLRRRMSAAIGYGPKLLGRVLRLQRALAIARAGEELAAAAFTAGYADQAHFCADCQDLAGVSPSQVVGRR